MAYGLNPRLFIENGPTVEAQRARETRSTDSFRAWRKLNIDRRFELIEGVLKAPANDLLDKFPIAL
jgi:hypothetical protein